MKHHSANEFSTFPVTFPSLVKLAHDDLLRPGWRRVAREVKSRGRKLVLVQLPVEQILDVHRFAGSGSSYEEEWLAVLHEQVHEVVVLGSIHRRNDLSREQYLLGKINHHICFTNTIG